MEKVVVKGQEYAVVAKADTTLTAPDGMKIELTAGQQAHFTAQSSTVSADADFTITATFNCAARKLRRLAGGVDKLEKYAKCETVDDMLAVNTDYKNDLTSDGEWVYYLTSLVDGQQLFNGAKIKKWGIKTVPKVQNMFRMFYASALIGDEFECDFPSCTNTHDTFAFTQCRVFRVSFGAYRTLAQTWYGSEAVEEIYGDFSKITSASNTFYKCLKLRVLDADWSSLSNGNGMFGLCELPKIIVLRVLNTIPTYTSGSHLLTIGIHVDHEADEEVIAAITAAEEKGWAVTVQWNGTATAAASVSTYGLRRRKPVYAKLGEPLEDGTLRLDWGHYVTYPSGYMEFASLEEAKEYFGVTE